MTDPVMPPDSATTADLTGRSFGGYTILRRLGQGGMADVYLATQESLGRRVALKILKPALACDGNYVQRFHNEAKSVAALVHPHIVQVYEIGQQDGLHFMAQEYVAGSSLKQRLNREGSLPVNVTVGIMSAAASALDKAALAGMIHRDIKPDNILLDSGGAVKVADFGLARKTDATALELTQTGMTMGTPLYMSPEQIEGRPLDGRSDIYSLGVTAYHMLAGRPPFEGDTPVAVAMKHVNQPAVPLTSVRPQVPEQLSDLVARMMAKLPEDRPGSGAVVLAELRECCGSLGLAADAHSSIASSGSRAARALDEAIAAGKKRQPSRWRSRSVWVPAIIGMVVAVILLGRDPLRSTRAAAQPAVPRKESVEKQFFYAMHVNSEQAWMAVMDYFPAKGERADPVHRAYHLKTKKQLIRWYVQHERPQAAMALINELASLDDTDREFQLFGRAFKVLALAHQGKEKEAIDILTDIWERRNELDSATRAQLQQVRRRLLNN